jgi:alkyldihydroxyacetonephosphate synthase
LRYLGIGKIRKQFLTRSIGETGIKVLKGLKDTIDPTNIFGSKNLI